MHFAGGKDIIFFCSILSILNFSLLIHAKAQESNEKSNETNENDGNIQEKTDARFEKLTNEILLGGNLRDDMEQFLKFRVIKDEKSQEQTTKTITKTSTASKILHTMSTIALKISKEILGNDKNTVSKKSLSETKTPIHLCPFLRETKCDPDFRFRSINGSCNNLEFPLLGQTGTPYKRYMEPSYDDGLDHARTLSKSGKELPSPRLISTNLFKDNFQFDNDYTHIVAFFGQFITHDFSMASVATDNNGIPLLCDCANSNVNCLPMKMPSSDIMRMTCMKFTRSGSTFSTFDCKLRHREQLNMLTSYVDASQVYGSDGAKEVSLRAFTKGLMKVSSGIHRNRTFLPHLNDPSCKDNNAAKQCFNAGDSRVNNNLCLASLHTIFIREHNRIAEELAKLNSGWDDQRLFEEARRILIAIYQHIVYTEYLPTLVGRNFIKAFDLEPKKINEYYMGYNQNVNPSVANEFSSAAFRFGHSLIRTHLGRYNLNNLAMSNSVNIGDVIFRPVEAYNEAAGGLDSLFISLINEPPSKFDTNIASHLQNHLFEVKVSDDVTLAEDLAAININRGRDHGIPSYNALREKCGFRRAETFNELSDLIKSPSQIMRLTETYEHVDDIDYYVGGLSEDSINGGLLGPTFSCIIALQFRDFKKGDRFFYENGDSNSPIAFTNDQLNEIKSSSLAGLICNSIDLNFVQPNVFLQPRFTHNSRISCDRIPKMDLTKWKEIVRIDQIELK